MGISKNSLMGIGVAGMKSIFDGVAVHDFERGAKGHLLAIENKGVGENLGHAFELMMGGNDEVAG